MKTFLLNFEICESILYLFFISSHFAGYLVIFSQSLAKFHYYIDLEISIANRESFLSCQLAHIRHDTISDIDLSRKIIPAKLFPTSLFPRI